MRGVGTPCVVRRPRPGPISAFPVLLGRPQGSPPFSTPPLRFLRCFLVSPVHFPFTMERNELHPYVKASTSSALKYRHLPSPRSPNLSGPTPTRCNCSTRYPTAASIRR